MRTTRRYVLALIGILLLAGCDRAGRASDFAISSSSGAGSAGAVTPTEPADNTMLLQELEAAMKKWEEHEITRYSLRVRHSQPTWNMQIIDVIVENGVVVESKQDCFPTRTCVLKKIEPQDFTIEALFEVARQVATLGDGPVEITFTDTYGYPNAIIYEDGFWNLETFQPLEAAP